MVLRICCACNDFIKLNMFYKNPRIDRGLRYSCINCDKERYNVNKHKIDKTKRYLKSKERGLKNSETIKEKRKIYREQNKETLKQKRLKRYYSNPEKYRKISKELRLKNIDKYRKIALERYHKNPEKQYNYRKLNSEKVKEKARLYKSIKVKTDLKFRLKRNISTRLSKFAKMSSFKKNKKSIKLIGCSIEVFKSHIEARFKDGMSWDNYGHKGWHIDHIIPLASGGTQKEMEELCNYKNLQPLWAIENLKKGAKIIY